MVRKILLKQKSQKTTHPSGSELSIKTIGKYKFYIPFNIFYYNFIIIGAQLGKEINHLCQ